jgi:hypothetical protein
MLFKEQSLFKARIVRSLYTQNEALLLLKVIVLIITFRL